MRVHREWGLTSRLAELRDSERPVELAGGGVARQLTTTLRSVDFPSDDDIAGLLQVCLNP